jgi:hypothetical protein
LKFQTDRGLLSPKCLEDAKIPDAKIPDAKIPDAKIPDAKIPDAKIPDGRVPIHIGNLSADESGFFVTGKLVWHNLVHFLLVVSSTPAPRGDWSYGS